MKIGIAITTVPERKKLLQEAIRQHKKYLPANATIHIHNDAERIGIARSKNNCIAYLMDQQCTHLFLFDDDCYPIHKDWHLIFINNTAQHATATFDRLNNGVSNGNLKKGTVGRYEYFQNPCGIVLYYTRQVIEQIGGMDINYAKYGHEHVGHSCRIHNAGLTPKPFISPIGAMDYIYSLDQHNTASSTINPVERAIACESGRNLIREEREEKGWKPYKKESFLLGAFFNSYIDQQRNTKWIPNVEQLSKWLKSSKECGIKAVLFTDCFAPGKATERQIYCKPTRIVYNYRFFAFRDWLVKFQDYIEFVLITDTTDVEIFAYPEMATDEIYIGSETWSDWIYGQTTQKQLPRQSTMLNCGIIGGHIATLLPFLSDMCEYMKNKSEIADMAAVNHILLKEKKYKFVTGHPLHTDFKKFQSDDGVVCIRHK